MKVNDTKKLARAKFMTEQEKKPEKWTENFDMSSIPEGVLKSFWSVYWGTGAGGSGGGRPQELKPCAICGKSFGGRALRVHLRAEHNLHWAQIDPRPKTATTASMA